jgi:alkaline phosphatase
MTFRYQRQTPASRAIPVALIAGLVLAAALAIGGCAFIVNARDIQAEPVPARTHPTNIIFMIGDGMGVGQVTAAKIESGDLNMERLPVGGLVTTFAGNTLVTDSAASGTAYATGHKTDNGAISVAPGGEPLKTVLEYAEERGMATGLVVTCSITHATPAVFAAHVENRNEEMEIAQQIAASGVDVLFGGGSSFFLPSDVPGGARKDGLNLIDRLRERMPVALSASEFRRLPKGRAAAALVTPGHPPRADMREPSLPEMTRKAISILSRDEDGFFLMVEGSQIDWAGHENEHDWLMQEVADFDDAVGLALDFAELDGRTLVVVTADHETGGYSVLDGSLEWHEVTRPSFCTGDHSANMVPILAYGPGSEAFGGINDNTDVGMTLIDYVRR